jgi:hypothetical protein
MEWTAFCEGKAVECELLAVYFDGNERTDWLRMAADWRAAVVANSNTPTDDGETS